MKYECTMGKGFERCGKPAHYVILGAYGDGDTLFCRGCFDRVKDKWDVCKSAELIDNRLNTMK